MKTSTFRITTEAGWIMSLAVIITIVILGLRITANRISELEERVEILQAAVIGDPPQMFLYESTVDVTN